MTTSMMLTLEKINFRIKKKQYIYDPQMQGRRCLRYYGDCPSCNVRMYGFDDGNNDHRGILKEHAVSFLDPLDFEMRGKKLYACYWCLHDPITFYNLLESVIATWEPQN